MLFHTGESSDADGCSDVYGLLLFQGCVNNFPTSPDIHSPFTQAPLTVVTAAPPW